MPYNAFISYSHAADGELAPAVQKSLHRFARPLFSRRALRTFRDKTSLGATPHLWQSIVEALDRSDYFILMASPESAQSHWVQQEIGRWLDRKTPDRLLIVLTGGSVVWDEQAGDFNWTKTTALPPGLGRVFKQEPLYVDLSWVESREHLSLRHSRFRAAIAQLAATLHDRPLDEISGEDVRQHRRIVRAVTGGVALLIVLTVVAFVAAFLAEKNRRTAIHRRFESISQALAAYAEREQEQSHRDERAALLARQAFLFSERFQANRLEQVGKALRTVLSKPYFSTVLSPAQGSSQLSAIALSSDGNYLAAGGEGRSIYLWDLSRHPPSPVELTIGENLIRALVFANHSHTLVAGMHDGRIVLWRLAQTTELTETITIESGLEQGIGSLSISADDQWLAVGGKDGRVYLWSLSAPDSQPDQICCHDQAVTAVSFHPTDTRLLASGSADKSVCVWDITQREEPLRRYSDHDNRIETLAFSHDGLWLAAGTELSHVAPSLKLAIKEQGDEYDYHEVGGTVWLWNISRAQEPPLVLRSADAVSVTALAFSDDDSRLVVNGANNDIVLWQWRTPGTPSIRLAGHRALVRALAYDVEGSWLVSLDDASGIRLWDPTPPVAAPRVFAGHEDAVKGVAFHAAGEQLAAVSGWGAYIWDIATHEYERVEVEDSAPFLTVAFHQQRPWLIIGSGGSKLDIDNTLRIWELPNTARPDQTLNGVGSALTSLAISRDGTWLAVAGRFDKRVLIWNLDATEEPPKIADFEQDVTALAYADGNDLFVAASDQVYRLSLNGNATTKHPIIESQGSRVNTLAYDANEQRLATGAADGTFRLWRITGSQQPASLERSLRYQTLHSVAFGPKGKVVAAGGEDGKVRLWNLEREMADAQVFDGPGRSVYSIAFSADGDWFAAGGSNNTVKLWPRTRWLANVVCQKVARNLSRREWDEYVGADISKEETCKNLALTSGDADYW